MRLRRRFVWSLLIGDSSPTPSVPLGLADCFAYRCQQLDLQWATALVNAFTANTRQATP